MPAFGKLRAAIDDAMRTAAKQCSMHGGLRSAPGEQNFDGRNRAAADLMPQGLHCAYVLDGMCKTVQMASGQPNVVTRDE